MEDVNEGVLVDPSSCYQNYNMAVNASEKTVYTYMGVLEPDLGNANYCSAGQFSPLLTDASYKTIGLGTRIFLGGAGGIALPFGGQARTTQDPGHRSRIRAEGGLDGSN